MIFYSKYSDICPDLWTGVREFGHTPGVLQENLGRLLEYSRRIWAYSWSMPGRWAKKTGGLKKTFVFHFNAFLQRIKRHISGGPPGGPPGGLQTGPRGDPSGALVGPSLRE
jgi:hypothetical protein